MEARKKIQHARGKVAVAEKHIGNKKLRTLDDMDLIRMILEQDPSLRERVMRHLENALGMAAGSANK